MFIESAKIHRILSKKKGSNRNGQNQGSGFCQSLMNQRIINKIKYLLKMYRKTMVLKIIFYF
jgi:hypothetical protein